MHDLTLEQQWRKVAALMAGLMAGLIAVLTACAGSVSIGLADTTPATRVNGIRIEAQDGRSGLARIGESLANARVAYVAGDSADHAELFHRTRLRLIRYLHEDLGFNVLVLPVGIFEGARIDHELAAGTKPADAAVTVYRVWRESDAFKDILRYVATTRDEEPPLEIIGGLCRFHATGKTLYAPHLQQFFEGAGEELLDDALAARIEASLAGRGRLSRDTAEKRLEASALVADLRKRFEESRPKLEAKYGKQRVELEHQFLVNMAMFVELEKIRGGDTTDDDGIETREKAQNLSWFLHRRYPREKIIYWGGRGAAADLPTDASVVRLEITLDD